MKRISLALICCFLFASFAIAQRTNCPYPQHEISFGYGGLSANQAGFLFADPIALGLFKDINDINTADNIKITPIGPINITYKYFFKYKASIGFSAIYSSNNFSDKNISNKTFGQLHTVAFLPRLDFYYKREPKYAIYGLFGLGVEGHFYNNAGSSDKAVSVAYQFSPLCFRAGRDFGFVLELGFGTLGAANAGFGYRHYNRPWSM